MGTGPLPVQIKAAGELALQLLFCHPEADLGPVSFLLLILGGSIGIFGLLKKKDLPRVMGIRSFMPYGQPLFRDYLPLAFLCPQFPFLADGVMDGLGGENETEGRVIFLKSGGGLAFSGSAHALSLSNLAEENPAVLSQLLQPGQDIFVKQVCS